jgi:hypothetical protein
MESSLVVRLDHPDLERGAPAMRVAIMILALMTLHCFALAGEDFDYFANSWSLIGLKDYGNATRVTPENRLLLANDTAVEIRFGDDLAPLGRQHTKRLLDGWLPVILLTAEDGNVRYTFTLWATPLPDVKDWRNAFDWPTEGENFLNWVLVEAANNGTSETRARVVIAVTSPADSWQREFEWSLPPGKSAEGFVHVPFVPVEKERLTGKEDPRLWLDRTTRYWKNLLARAARIEVPCEKATHALLASHVYQLIASDHGVLKPGEGFYDAFYIRDGAYQVMQLEEAGLMDSATNAMESFFEHQRTDGRFESQAGELDANGQAVWALWQFYKITGDRGFLERAYPKMLKATEWTITARHQAAADSPFAGLLPNSNADGEFLWDGQHHIVGYDFWNLRGLICTAQAARALGKADEAERLFEEADSYRSAIGAAWERTGLEYFPPSWEGEGTHWGNTETLWPTPLFAESDQRVAALIREVRERFGGGFVEGTIQWRLVGAIHPYMSMYTTMASLARGDHEQVVEDFYWYLLHSSAAHAFPEGIYYGRRYAWGETIPHMLGSANYALMLRHMLVHETDDELHLLRAVPDWWLEEGKEIRVERAPTHFGLVSFRVRGLAGGVQVELEPPDRVPPSRILLHLPKSRPLLNSVAGVEVVVRPDQRKRWDFPTVLALYRDQVAERNTPIPGLLAMPLEEEPERSRCRMLDLTAVVNTDPFSAPFGVENPGIYTFKDMPVGIQEVSGIPFRIIDPAENQGRGIVVLHSQDAPRDKEWPRAIEIPVGQKAKRMFFLGNVHGYASDDPGVGKWGAVAEYVIQYADGTEQIVPLSTGKTIDDWALSPGATQVVVGPKGYPWHLNVLGVELRNVEIEKVLFRDTGTPAAPLLAAITIEK